MCDRAGARGWSSRRPLGAPRRSRISAERGGFRLPRRSLPCRLPWRIGAGLPSCKSGKEPNRPAEIRIDAIKTMRLLTKEIDLQIEIRWIDTLMEESLVNFLCM